MQRTRLKGRWRRQGGKILKKDNKARATSRLGSRMAERFAELGLTENLAELRGESPRPANLDD